MKHSDRNKSFELEKAKREYFAEEIPVKDYKWEDEICFVYGGYELDDPKHPDYHDTFVDYYDIYGEEF